MFIFLISRLAASRVVHCVGPPSYRKLPTIIPAAPFVMPRLASRHARNHHVIPASHHAIPAVLFVMPHLASRRARLASRHSREGGNLAPHFRRAFLGTPPPRYIKRNRSAKIVDRVVAIQVEFSRVAYRNESVVIDAKN